jgi:regulator of sigma E protease
MEIIDQSLGSLWGVLAVLLPFLFVLTVVVFVHDLGHLLIARWCGVKVSTFSIGVGRELFGFFDRQGMRWRFAWIPLGTHMKFLEHKNATSGATNPELTLNNGSTFQSKPLWVRIAVVAAGPIASFLLAVVIFALTVMFVGKHVTAPRVDELVPDGVAISAGFKPGDLMVSIDGQPIETFEEMQRIVSSSADRLLTFEVNRGGTMLSLQVTPARREVTDRFGNKLKVGMIGIKRNARQQQWEYKRYGPIEAIGVGVRETFFIISQTLSYLSDVFMGHQSADQLGGPIRIAEVSSQVASVWFVPLLNLTAVLSVSIGLINLFPLPMLDGGNLLFYLIEGVCGRSLSERIQKTWFRIWLIVLFILIMFATWNDLGIVRRWLTGIG